MTEEKQGLDPVQNNQASKKSLLTPVIFIVLLLAIAITIVNQVRQASVSNRPISNKTFFEFPDRKPVPVVTLEQAGKGRISTEVMKGKWHLLFFGYTFCPDVCPVELTVLHQMTDILREQLPPEQLPQTLFISIDPERDTPEMMEEYVTYFDPDFIGLTGKKTDLKILTMAFGVSWMKQPNTDTTTIDDISPGKKKDKQNYLISHTTSIILVNPEMKVAGLFTAPHSAKEMAEVYQQVIQKEAL